MREYLNPLRFSLLHVKPSPSSCFAQDQHHGSQASRVSTQTLRLGLLLRTAETTRAQRKGPCPVPVLPWAVSPLFWPHVGFLFVVCFSTENVSRTSKVPLSAPALYGTEQKWEQHAWPKGGLVHNALPPHTTAGRHAVPAGRCRGDGGTQRSGSEPFGAAAAKMGTRQSARLQRLTLFALLLSPSEEHALRNVSAHLHMYWSLTYAWQNDQRGKGGIFTTRKDAVKEHERVVLIKGKSLV